MYRADVGRSDPTGRRSLQLRLALLAARVAVWLTRTILRRRGGVIGGRVLLILAPDSARQLARGHHITMVSGTNGKSTATAMLTAAVDTYRESASNVGGANVPAGLVTALMEAETDHLVLEVDEGWLPWAIEELRPECVALLNLSRDQLHRHPEVHGLAETWREALRAVPLVVANADDSEVVWAASTARDHIWVAGGKTWKQDSTTCPQCHQRLEHDATGWHCTCGLTRPNPDWWVAGNSVIRKDQVLPLRIALPGAANLSNAAMALAASTAVGAQAEAAARAVESIREVSGRYGQFLDSGHDVRLLLAKNPASWLEATNVLRESGAPLVAAFNSDGVDGRDPSWLYDVDVTALAGRPISVCGRRATDMAVRLQLAGLGPIRQHRTLRAALKDIAAHHVDVVANYTAFQEAVRELRHGQH